MLTSRFSGRHTLPLAATMVVVAAVCTAAFSQGSPPAPAANMPAAATGVVDWGLWGLFRQSFDVFTILLVSGSVIALAVAISCIIDIREGRILPREATNRIIDLAAVGRWQDLREFVARDESFVGRVMRTALAAGTTRDAIRESAELAAAEEAGRWFRRIELLNVIGNLGPLIGLAGTVYGMILAFASLSASGGQAGPSDLSLGISKALFHTLLGLTLAIPCLFVFGLYRSAVDRICTRGTVICGRVVEQVPEQDPSARK